MKVILLQHLDIFSSQQANLYLLSLAETIDADYIVSGDKDLTDLYQHLKTRIIKLADFKLMMGL